MEDYSNAGLNHLDALHMTRRAVRNSVEDVLDVAFSLKRVGMRDLAEELISAVGGLSDMVDATLKTWLSDQDAQMDHGNKMLSGILMLGMKIADAPPQQMMESE